MTMRHVEVRSPLPGGAPHWAISMPTGHYRLADGSLLRVDIELGHFVGTLYSPGLSVKRQVHGSADNVHAWVDRIAAGYPVVAPHPETYR
jgi:hypothetical protein